MLWAIQPTDMLWAIQPTGMLWAIQPTGMLWAIQPTEALGYPAHRNALGYPAHRNAGSYPAHRNALGYPAHRNALGYPAHRNALGYPAHRNIYPAYFTMCQHTPHFFFAHVLLLVQLLLLVGLHLTHSLAIFQHLLQISCQLLAVLQGATLHLQDSSLARSADLL